MSSFHISLSSYKSKTNEDRILNEHKTTSKSSSTRAPLYRFHPLSHIPIFPFFPSRTENTDLFIPLQGGGGDCVQANGGGRNGNGSANDSLTVTEHQVAKLMEEDMGSAMQYLQGKGLCLMPISLASAISTATCHSGRPPAANPNPLAASNGDGPTSPSMSVMTAQSATVGIGGAPDGSSGKEAASVPKS